MSSGSRATISSQGPKYQGYPYVNPPSFGVPTIDPYTAARWVHLPRRPIGSPVRIEDQAGTSGTHQVQRDRESSPIAGNKEDVDRPVVYVDIPDTDSSICEARNHKNQNNVKTLEETISYRSDDEPVLYIDLPEDGESDMYERDVGTPAQPSQSRLHQSERQPNKDEFRSCDDEEPVVYIDIPECSGSGVSERRPTIEDGPSTSVVQETIFYDQFKDRRIDVPTSPRDSDTDSPFSSNNSTLRRPFRNPALRRPNGSMRRPYVAEFDEEIRLGRPPIPTTLNLWSAGTSSGNADASTSSGLDRPTPTYLPSYLTPTEYQLRVLRTPDDIQPVTEFPEPPPAYTEIDLTSPSNLRSPQTLGTSIPTVASTVPTAGSVIPNLGTAPNMGNPVQIRAVTQQPQRTTVIQNENADRKFLTCQYCGVIVHTLVVPQNSIWTHVAAVCCLIFGLFPCTIGIYCCDKCMGKAHYCPNCNKKIHGESCYDCCLSKMR